MPQREAGTAGRKKWCTFWSSLAYGLLLNGAIQGASGWWGGGTRGAVMSPCPGPLWAGYGSDHIILFWPSWIGEFLSCFQGWSMKCSCFQEHTASVPFHLARCECGRQWIKTQPDLLFLLKRHLPRGWARFSAGHNGTYLCEVREAFQLSNTLPYWLLSPPFF